MRGHCNSFGVTDNSRALYRFEQAVLHRYASCSTAGANGAASRGRAFAAIEHGIPSRGLAPSSPCIPSGESPSEEACAGKPQAGFCEGEAHNGAGSNSVTLSRPKGESNGEYKADLHTEGVPKKPA